MSPAEIALIADESALSRAATDWRELFDRSPEATPFQSPDWLIPWWRAFRPGALATIALRRDGAVAAVLPAYLEDGAHGRRLLPLGIGISDYLDVLCADRHDLAALAEAAATRSPAWQRFELGDLVDGATALDVPCPEGCSEERARQCCAPVLFDRGAGLAAAVPATKQRKLRMARNRALRRGSVTIEQAEVPATVERFLSELMRLHRARWRADGEDGVLADATVTSFHAEALPRLVDAGLARLYLLAIEDRVIGAYYGFLRGRRAYAYLQGYDPDFAHESPGTILVGHAIAEAAREGATEFHFLRGEEPYKASWGADARWTTRRTFHRSGT